MAVDRTSGCAVVHVDRATGRWACSQATCWTLRTPSKHCCRHYSQDVEKAKKKMEADDARRAARAEERAAAAAASRPSLGELVAAEGAAAGGKAVAKR